MKFFNRLGLALNFLSMGLTTAIALLLMLILNPSAATDEVIGLAVYSILAEFVLAIGFIVLAAVAGDMLGPPHFPD